MPYRVVHKVVVPVPPSANDYWRPVKSRIVDTEAARAYKQRIRWELSSQGVRPVQGPLCVWLRWYRKTLIRADLGNRIKVLEDALNGVAWDDDSQIEEIHAYRHLDRENPRVELTVAIIEPEERDGRQQGQPAGMEEEGPGGGARPAARTAGALAGDGRNRGAVRANGQPQAGAAAGR